MASLTNDHVTSCPVDSTQPLKPFSEMPGPKGLPYIGTLWEYMKRNGLKFNKMFQVMEMRAKAHGSIYKENIGVMTSVVVSDPSEYAKVMRGEGRCPHRIELDPMVHYRMKRGMSLGAINSQGVEWYRHRAVLNKKMLMPKEVLNYLEPMNEVASDFVNHLHRIRGADGRITNIENEVFMWAMESIGTVLFEDRIGCFKEPPSLVATEFIKNLVGYFKTMQGNSTHNNLVHLASKQNCKNPLLYSMPVYKYFPTKRWRVHEQYGDKVAEIGLDYIHKVRDRPVLC
ncbi:Cytochrome P450 10 [Lamellibrachia satsuma]|nr:Cytochrome P450 10 [Lamellibrachia satsuma]